MKYLTYRQFYLYFYHVQKCDALVGDITILASRSLYVDFTLPYTESGVSMIVPIIDNRSKSVGFPFFVGLLNFLNMVLLFLANTLVNT